MGLPDTPSVSPSVRCHVPFSLQLYRTNYHFPPTLPLEKLLESLLGRQLPVFELQTAKQL